MNKDGLLSRIEDLEGVTLDEERDEIEDLINFGDQIFLKYQLIR